MHIMTYTNFPSDWMFGGIEFGHATEAFEWKNDIFCTKNSNFHEPVELTLPYSHKYVTWLACGTWIVKNHLGMTLDFLQVHLNGKKTFFYTKPSNFDLNKQRTVPWSHLISLNHVGTVGSEFRGSKMVLSDWNQILQEIADSFPALGTLCFALGSYGHSP